MNDAPPPAQDQVAMHKALVVEFLAEVGRELERIRAGNNGLGAFDPVSWRKLQNMAHNIGARADGLRLGVLQLCARELEQFAVAILKPTDSDKSESIQAAMIALEMLKLELLTLQRSSESS